jgi:glycosyltransferase involved in cell wall biosynthesis
MEYSPLVTIVIPTYNRGYIIGETLDSVLNQTYANWECIVVDDGGSDTTNQVLEKYKALTNRFQYIKRPIDYSKGVCSCRNYGVAVSKGEFIIFLDSDDILSSVSLYNRVKYFKQYPNNDFLVFSTRFFDNDIINKKELFNIDPIMESRENYLSFFLKYQFAWQTMSPIWRTKYVSENKFRHDLHLLEDVVFHIEVLFDTNVKFKRIKEIDNFYRIPNWGKNNTVESVDKIFASTSYLLEKYNHKIIQNEILVGNFSFFLKNVYKIILQSNKQDAQKKAMLNHFLKYKYITKKERLLFKVFHIIYKYELNTSKNIGMYKLINILNRILLE